ncbi:MAG: phosphate acyltransferase PlsX [Desulfovibrionaceae bacterium]|nr:phosphate acyltransferase PlsX [Desulfovibrionaceae bacterium]
MNNNDLVLAVDAMGGDFGPPVVVPGALSAARSTGARVLLVGQEHAIRESLDSLPARDRPEALYDIVPASQVVEMEEKPSEILRTKKDSSIQVACRLVKQGQARGIISAGHSGAAVACGMFILGRIPGVERPALATILPTEKAPMLLLDVGANVECRPHHLFQFGLMGTTFAQDILGYENPRLGILSIGEEEGKGNSLVKSSYELLKMAQHLNFLGNVEGRDLFTGNVDVVVCDGFVGNVALKLSEGLGTSLTNVLKRELLSSGLLPKVGTLLARSAFRKFGKMVDYAEYGGAPLLGLQAVAIVCHGASNSKAISSAVAMAATYVEKGTHKRLVNAISANEELTRYARSV